MTQPRDHEAGVKSGSPTWSSLGAWDQACAWFDQFWDQALASFQDEVQRSIESEKADKEKKR